MQNLQRLSSEERERQFEMADVEGLHRDQPELTPLEQLLEAANIGINEIQIQTDSESDENSEFEE